MKRPAFVRTEPSAEYYTPERCHILELSNSVADPAASVARARVEPGVATRWHRVDGTVERYVILAGSGDAEIGDEPPRAVAPGDVVVIPAGCRQRIRNTGESDLVFLCICTPRFEWEHYTDLE